MKKSFFFLFLSVQLLCAFEQVPDAEQLKKQRLHHPLFETIPNDRFSKTLKIVTLGDSLTKGIGDSTKKGGYLPYLKARMEAEKGIKEVDFVRFGERGSRTTHLLNSLKTSEVSTAVHQADIIIVTIGGNDIMKVIKDNISHLNTSVFYEEQKKYKRRLIRIFDCLRANNPNALLVLVGLYNPLTEWVSEMDELNQIISSWNQTDSTVISAYQNACFIPIDDLFAKNGTQLLFKDHFHPNDRGYALIAKRLNEHLIMKAIH